MQKWSEICLVRKQRKYNFLVKKTEVECNFIVGEIEVKCNYFLGTHKWIAIFFWKTELE